jgi:DnaK suppressor protein
MKKMKKTVKKAAVKKAPVKKAAKILSAPHRAPAVKAAQPSAPKKTSASEALTKAELAEIAAGLSEMKTDIAKNVEDKKNLDLLEPEVGDSIDQATQSLDKEILFELSDNERKILRDIEAALRKMEKGTYGLCEHCKNIIEKKRIKALPSARYCMACQSGSEKNRV